MKNQSSCYSFDTIIDRRGTDCSKWDDFPCEIKAPDMLPMWTADMDFACPPAIMAALQKRLSHPIFGYYALPSRYQRSIIHWQKERFDCSIHEEEIVPVASVLGGVAMAIQAFTQKGDAILVPTPGYHAFFHAIANNERRLVRSPLQRSGDHFQMDFAHMEEQIRAEQVKMVIFCSPHNPTGRVWTEDELSRLVDLCDQYNVCLLSDEIHADMTLTVPFTPLFKIANPRVEKVAVALYAPTKTFNIAGLCTAYAVIRNQERRERFQKVLLASGLKVKNTLGLEALMTGYEQCGEWVDALRRYLLANAEYAVDFIRSELPCLRAYVPEATYFLWLDFSGTGLDQDAFMDKLTREAHLVVNRGDEFLDGGERCVRIVCACPRAQLTEALERIKKVLTEGLEK